MQYYEIVEPYYKSLGLQIIKGDGRSMQPLGVFCLHDYIFQLFNKDIRDIKLSHEGNKWKNEWRKANDLHFKKFFMELNDDQRDAIIDIMDDFTEYTQNSVELIRFAVMDCVNDVPVDCQKIIASMQVCNVFAQLAQMRWQEMIKPMRFFSNKLKYNDAVRRYSSLLSDGLYRGQGGKHLNEKAEDRLMTCIDAFDRKYIDWINLRSKDESR